MSDKENNEHTELKRKADSGAGGLESMDSAERALDVTHGHLVQDLSADVPDSPVQWCVEQEVECLFGWCIEEVERLRLRREALVQELLEEERPLQEAVQELRLQLSQAHTRLSHTQLLKDRLQEEISNVKKKLFIVMRDCIQSQITLAAQQYEVAQFKYIQEELQAEVLKQLQGLSQLREEQNSRLAALRERLQGRGRPRAMSDLSHCRRASADLSRYTRASMRSLEQWYEPRFLVLLKRRQISEDTLRKSRELGQDLKKHLQPLKEETDRLDLEREKLQKKISLMEQERKENLTLHKEMVWSLEESVRELQTELQIQINTNRELTQLNDLLTEHCSMYRRCLGYTDGSEAPNEETDGV